MRFVREVQNKEHIELERMSRQEVGRVAIRAKMVLLSSQGYTVPEIESIFQTTKVTIYKWFTRFDDKGTADMMSYAQDDRQI